MNAEIWMDRDRKTDKETGGEDDKTNKHYLRLIMNLLSYASDKLVKHADIQHTDVISKYAGRKCADTQPTDTQHADAQYTDKITC
jgi:hypothetical protein